MLNFAELKARVSLEDAIEYLNLPMTLKEGKYRGVCPACQSSNQRALVVTPGAGAYCFDAKKGGDVIWLVSHVQKVGIRTAAEELDQAFPACEVVEERTANVVKNGASNTKRPEGNTKGPEGIASVASKLQADHPMVMQLGLTVEQATALGVGYMGRGSLAQRVLIPIRTQTGEPVCYAGWNPEKDPTLKFGRINL